MPRLISRQSKTKMKFEISCIVPSSQTGGRVAVFAENVQPQMGPPLHSHTKQIEIFHIISGTFLFQLDDQRITLASGGAICIPPGAAHTFKNIGDSVGTIRFELLEAGKSEEFFRRIVTEIETIDDIPSFFAQYDLELLGPPL